MPLNSDEHYMQEAIKEAVLAQKDNEIPVGAVVVCENKIIARAHNYTEKLQDATAHAEMLAITSASNYLGFKYLSECTLYVTLEPCVMCAGALHWSQIKRLVYGAHDMQRGFTLVEKNLLHPKTEVLSGVLLEKCTGMLNLFFKQLRKK